MLSATTITKLLQMNDVSAEVIYPKLKPELQHEYPNLDHNIGVDFKAPKCIIYLISEGLKWLVFSFFVFFENVQRENVRNKLV